MRDGKYKYKLTVMSFWSKISSSEIILADTICANSEKLKSDFALFWQHWSYTQFTSVRIPSTMFQSCVLVVPCHDVGRLLRDLAVSRAERQFNAMPSLICDYFKELD